MKSSSTESPCSDVIVNGVIFVVDYSVRFAIRKSEPDKSDDSLGPRCNRKRSSR